ncbi:MAG: biopolymer transporter ExbD [Phycisphaeraceae bacterium]|nr:biopolymer transporter ExbD [Phycisphaeraceae bacterium]
MNFVKGGKRASFAGFDMTPMIDVVLQLIIFFMYTSQFAQLARTPVELPEEQGDELHAPAANTITIDLTSSGGILLEGESVDLEQLARIVALEVERAGGDPSQVSVLIRADRGLSAQHLNAVAERLGAIGLRGWQLGTNVPNAWGAPPR